MNSRSKDALQEAIPPIASLICKSEKAQQKLKPGTWQHTMLQENLRALRMAFALMSGRTNGADVLTQDAMQAALRAFAAMTRKSKQAQVKFAPGTSQYTLQQNRLRAFRLAEAMIRAELK